jgi:hypothetical protein
MLQTDDLIDSVAFVMQITRLRRGTDFIQQFASALITPIDADGTIPVGWRRRQWASHLATER